MKQFFILLFCSLALLANAGSVPSHGTSTTIISKQHLDGVERGAKRKAASNTQKAKSKAPKTDDLEKLKRQKKLYMILMIVFGGGWLLALGSVLVKMLFILLAGAVVGNPGQGLEAVIPEAIVFGIIGGIMLILALVFLVLMLKTIKKIKKIKEEQAAQPE